MRVRTVLASTLICLGIAGCNNGGGGGTGGGSSVGGGSGAGGGVGSTPVSGHAIDFYRLASSEETRPNPHLSSMLAWAPQTDGGVTALTIDVDGSGGFSIPDAPAGEYDLQDGDLWIVTTSRQLDLHDHTHQGRLGLITPTDSVATTVNATGVVPGIGVEFEVVNPNQGLVGGILLFGQASMSNVTAVPGAVFAESGGFPDGTVGDQTWVSERIDCMPPNDGGPMVSLGDGDYRSCTADSNSCTLTSVAIDPNDGGSITLALAPMGAQNLAATLDPAPYLSHLTDVHPQATEEGFGLMLQVTPGTAVLFDARVATPALPIVVSYTPPRVGTHTFSQAYADPYPAEWTRTILWSYGFHTPTELPGANPGSGLNAVMTEVRPLSMLPSSLTPRLSAPLHLTVDGMPAGTDSTLSRPNPRLEWSAPSLGTPKGYVGFVYQLTDNTFTISTEVLSFITADTHFQLPTGALGTGTYVFDVFAWGGPAIDFVNAPYRYRSAVDASIADTISGIWTMP